MDLPALEHFDGDWNDYVDKLYGIFLETIVYKPLIFNGLPVRYQRRPETDGKGYSFWHMIQEGNIEDERTPDFRRCERIRWFSWIIENAQSTDEISWWENKRGRNTHVVLWLESEQFAVILAKRKDYYLIKTAYVVKSGRQRAFRKERAKFLESLKS